MALAGVAQSIACIAGLAIFHKDPELISGYYESCAFVVMCVLGLLWGFCTMVVASEDGEEEIELTQEGVAWRIIAFLTFPISVPLFVLIELYRWWNSLDRL